MAKRKPQTYAAAGVNIDEAERATAKIKRLAQQTFSPQVLTGIGSFGAMFALHEAGFRRPVLISSADGVGTKLKVAAMAAIHHTVGQDLVNHCVNDIAVQGAIPQFFLDYFAAGKLDARVTAEVVRGLSIACKQNNCSLIGGETAEMPGMYQPGDYDLAGFIVGAAERSKLIDGSKIEEGDILLGLPSTGLHTNGYSLARKLFFETAGFKANTEVPLLKTTAAAELLKIHRSYLKPIRLLADAKLLRGAAHITGGGITDNTPRMLPKGLAARIQTGTWPILPVFRLLAEIGNIAEDEMLRTFNMGLGLIAAVPKRQAARAAELLASAKVRSYAVGHVTAGPRKVVYE